MFDSPTTAETESETATTVKTGDDTPVGRYLAVALLALAVLAEEYFRRKRTQE